MPGAMRDDLESDVEADWHRRVVGRSLRTAASGPSIAA